MPDELYLDHNASAPLLPEAREAVLEALADGPGNPSSSHGAGRRLKKRLEDARELVAGLVGAGPAEVVFTSGTSESNALGVLGALAAAQPAGVRNGLVTSLAEHPSITGLADHLEAEGHPVRRAPVDAHGRVDAAAFVGLVDDVTAVATLVLAEPVTGAIEPVGEVGAALAGRAVALHVDAAQAVGRIDVRRDDLGADQLSLSSHKLGGPAGIGALVIRTGARWRHPAAGGTHERGRRPGTPAVALAAGFGAAAAIALARGPRWAREAAAVTAAIRGGVEARGGVVITPRDGCLPNTLLVAFDGCPGDALLVALDAQGVRVSTGSACASGARVPPAVLLAGGHAAAAAAGAVRISVGPGVGAEHVPRLLRVLDDVVPRVRAALQTG